MDRGIDPAPVADLRHSDTAGEVELPWSGPADGDDGRADSFILMWRVGSVENPDPDDLPEGAESVVIPVRDKQAGDMMDTGATVLFVSHNLDQVKRICNKAMILEHGEMKAFGDIDEIAPVYEEMIE